MNFLRTLKSIARRQTSDHRSQRGRARLLLEELESRLTPSTLFIDGNPAPSANNYIQITSGFQTGDILVDVNGHFTNYNLAQFSSIQVNPGGGSNEVDVNTSLRVPITINSASGATDLINYHASTIGGVTINGNGKDDVRDFDGSSGFYTVTNNTVTGDQGSNLTYSGVASLLIDTAAGELGTPWGEIDVNSTAAGTAYTFTLQQRTGGIHVELGDPTSSSGLSALAGPITVNGATTLEQAQSNNEDQINLHDDVNPTPYTYTFTSTTVSRQSFAGLTYNTMPNVTLYCETVADTFNIDSNAASTTLNIQPLQSGGPAAVFNLGNGNLDAIQGKVELGANTNDMLNINDQGSTETRNYNLNNQGRDFTWNAGATLVQLNASLVTINGGTVPDSYSIDTAEGETYTINTATGNDTINLSYDGSPLGLNESQVTVNGVGGWSTVTASDLANAAASYTISGSSVERDGSNMLTLNGIAALTVNGATEFNPNIDTFDIESTALGKPVTINGGGDGNQFLVSSTIQNLSNLAASVTLHGAGSSNSLTVDDQSATAAESYTITPASISRSGSAGITYSGMQSVTVNGGNHGSTYNIQGTSLATFVAVNGGVGNDTFNVGSSNSLGGIQGAVTINGGGGINTLNANDSSSATGQSYTLSSTQLAGTDFASITYALMHALTATGSGNDTLTLLTPVPIVATTFNGGTGTNTLHGANVANSWTISGPNSGKLDSVSFSNFQNLIGGNTDDSFKFTAGTAHVATINGGLGGINGGSGGTNRLDYSALGSTFAVTVNLETGSAPLITNGFSSINAVAGSSDTANTLMGANIAELWTLTAANTGTITYHSGIFPFIRSFSFTAMPHLVGGTGVDDFKFSNTSATVLSINGGGAPAHQGDWLDYSSLPSTSTVTVNLATGSASNVNGGAAGAVTNIQNVIGSGSGTNNLTGDAQGNILIGGSGTNTLIGGSGGSLLIGGSGHGSITGGSGSDILIAGTTTYNSTTTVGQDALMSILAELQSADTFAQKVSDLFNGNNLGGGSDLNGSNKLTWGGTVRASTGAFTLSGDTSASSAADWFFSSASSTVNDFNDDSVKDEHNNNAIGVV